MLTLPQAWMNVPEGQSLFGRVSVLTSHRRAAPSRRSFSGTLPLRILNSSTEFLLIQLVCIMRLHRWVSAWVFPTSVNELSSSDESWNGRHQLRTEWLRKHKAETQTQLKKRSEGKNGLKKWIRPNWLPTCFIVSIVSEVPLIYININGGGALCMEGVLVREEKHKVWTFPQLSVSWLSPHYERLSSSAKWTIASWKGDRLSKGNLKEPGGPSHRSQEH